MKTINKNVKQTKRPNPEEPCERRRSSTVLRETWGETPLVYSTSISRIESIERGRIKIRDEMIPISDTYRSKVYDLLNIS